MKKQAEQWLSFSQIDLASIEKLMEDELLNQSSAFHAHQSVEKALKAILELKDKKIPKNHDLESLLENVRNVGISLTINEDTLDEINQVYIDSRYPSDFGLLPGGLPTNKKIQKFNSFAKDLYEQVKSLVNINSTYIN